MPKAKWANTDLTADDINNAEEREGGYAGELPPKGVYRFKLGYIKQDTSKAGNDKLVIMARLDGTWKDAKFKEFGGCPIWDHMPLGKESAFRPKALCSALGVTAADLMNKTIVDESGMITKIGAKAITEGMPLFISVRVDRQDGYDPSLKTNGTGYLPAPDEGDAEEAKPAKGKKNKKGKAAAETEEDPF